LPRAYSLFIASRRQFNLVIASRSQINLVIASRGQNAAWRSRGARI